jgi:hypothetical protein
LLELAEAFAVPADELSRRITEREVAEWALRGKPLWPRRLELMLAQLTSVVAQVAGNKVSLLDFDLFAPPPLEGPALSAESGAQALGSIAGGVGVRVLGKKRKKVAADGNESR